MPILDSWPPAHMLITCQRSLTLVSSSWAEMMGSEELEDFPGDCIPTLKYLK